MQELWAEMWEGPERGWRSGYQGRGRAGGWCTQSRHGGQEGPGLAVTHDPPSPVPFLEAHQGCASYLGTVPCLASGVKMNLLRGIVRMMWLVQAASGETLEKFDTGQSPLGGQSALWHIFPSW